MDIDTKQFWADDEKAHMENCFSADAPQAALGIRMSDECVFAELGEEGDPWGNTIAPERRVELNRRYNDKSEKIVGKRLLSEDFHDPGASFPNVKRIGEVFGGKYQYHSGAGEWLSSDIKTIKQLESRLDIVDSLDMESFMLPPNWHSEKQRIFEQYGRHPEPLRHIRGPVTLATSIFGVENLIFLYYDAKEVYERFSASISAAILKMAEVLDREAGFDERSRPAGFSFADDDCNLLTAEMYEAFGYPVLCKVFDHYSPKAGDIRYQHSDSPMEHLLPVLSRLNLTGCNFGPTVTVDKIRKYMPATRIDGCLAPFTFMDGDKDKIRDELLRDYRMTMQSGVKGLNFTTAGSINNGSSLESMLYIMALIQNNCRY